MVDLLYACVFFVTRALLESLTGIVPGYTLATLAVLRWHCTGSRSCLFLNERERTTTKWCPFVTTTVFITYKYRMRVRAKSSVCLSISKFEIKSTDMMTVLRLLWYQMSDLERLFFYVIVVSSTCSYRSISVINSKLTMRMIPSNFRISWNKRTHKYENSSNNFSTIWTFFLSLHRTYAHYTFFNRFNEYDHLFSNKNGILLNLL